MGLNLCLSGKNFLSQPVLAKYGIINQWLKPLAGVSMEKKPKSVFSSSRNSMPPQIRCMRPNLATGLDPKSVFSSSRGTSMPPQFAACGGRFKNGGLAVLLPNYPISMSA